MSERDPRVESLHVWTIVADPDRGEKVRRLPVPGGWLYQVEMSTNQSSTTVMSEKPDYYHHGWHPPVFVPTRMEWVGPDDPDPIIDVDAVIERLDRLRGDMATVGGNALVEAVRELAVAIRGVGHG